MSQKTILDKHRSNTCAYVAHLKASSATLDGLRDFHLVSVDLLSGRSGFSLVDVHELGEIELGLLEHLGLSDKDVLERIDRVADLLYFFTDNAGSELAEEVLQVDGRLLGHDFDHLGANRLLLGSLGVRRLLHLRLASLGESDAEETKGVSVGRLDVNPSLDKTVPLLDEGAKLVAREGHSVEVSEALGSLNVLDGELDLAEEEVLVLLQVSEGDLKDASLEGVGGRLKSSGSVHDGASKIAVLVDGRSLDGVPLFAGHRVRGLLAASLLSQFRVFPALQA